MKLANSTEWCKTQYRSALTLELDSLSGISKYEYYELFYHYIEVDDLSIKDKCLGIRVPGGTVGGIWIDDNNVITKIKIDTDYVVKTYPNDVNQRIQKFIGETLEWQTGETMYEKEILYL